MSNDSQSVGKTRKLRIVIIIQEVTQMDLIKIGNFIAELRKKQKLTANFLSSLYHPVSSVLESLSDHGNPNLQKL